MHIYFLLTTILLLVIVVTLLILIRRRNKLISSILGVNITITGCSLLIYYAVTGNPDPGYTVYSTFIIISGLLITVVSFLFSKQNEINR